ncbi:MAG: MBOAT family protein [Rikenellaceae bacterium]|nr:MBOAT family protein [Rikenellaceae bacterium]
MLFNSFEFAVFLPAVFLSYWFVFNRNLRLQNLFIAAVSYLFYGWWDWRFLLLIALTSGCSYLSGILIERSDARTAGDRSDRRNHSRLISASNIVLNLLILGVFKYFNFFSENLERLFQAFGYQLDWLTIDILLPVGISFYTFQALSYTIDVYKRKLAASHDPVGFFAYVSFFPQLVAGPIERATNLLPQFARARRFDYARAVDGLRQILWGLFKKIVVADNCGLAVDAIFADYGALPGSTLLLGGVLFAFQIYGDFSGYSDIAVGTARLFGFSLMRNFNCPYFSRDIAEFWRRWHISLSTWFRDYVYIPLGGSRGTRWMSVRNTMVVFLASGLWHGADWTFLAWGAYHALLFLPLLLARRNRRYTSDVVAQGRRLPSWRETLQMLSTFMLVVLGWIVFRAESVAQAWDYLGIVFSRSLFAAPHIHDTFSVYIVLMLAVEWLQRGKSHALDIGRLPLGVRWAVYILLPIVCLMMNTGSQSFIYFQF